MVNCSVIQKPPNKLNIKYRVQTKPENPLSVVMPLVNDIVCNGTNADKCIIFCPSYAQCCLLFQILVDELGKQNCLYLQDKNVAVCNIFTAATEKKVKDNILSEFTKPNSLLRIVVATIAFGMGVDAPNIRHVIHWGPPRSIEAYVQESGRCGRDGKSAIADLYFTGQDFSGHSNAKNAIKVYCNTANVCRRHQLMEHFDTLGSIDKPCESHNCCDVCSCECKCLGCLSKCNMESEELTKFNVPSTSHILPHAQKKIIVKRLEEYRLTLCPTDQPALFGIEILTGIPDSTIDHIVDNLAACTIDFLMNEGLSHQNSLTILQIVKGFMHEY